MTTLPVMTGKLAWESIESMVAEERQQGERARREDPFADEAMRLIANLWEWAAGRELEAGSAP
jgi:hypothetical protein